jgi:hypothetical protein
MSKGNEYRGKAAQRVKAELVLLVRRNWMSEKSKKVEARGRYDESNHQHIKCRRRDRSERVGT